VDSPPLRSLVSLTNRPSDNFFAEMLLKEMGARFGDAGSTPAGAAVVRRQLARWGIHPHIVDGSGLSRSDRTSPHGVVELLRHMREGETGSALNASLPVAGRSGTLVHRMRGTSAQGRCRAKTGTLNGVSALAGYCRAADGHELAFAFLMNRVGVPTARSAQDRMAAALAGYTG
jgi:D-alanyl-D-alanine carboxypeptidase/D-alanyl-D-alanine-endopeptidase (penicillin-binding protein 4)